MDKIKKGLGRGLSSLIGETKVEVQKNHIPITDLISIGDCALLYKFYNMDDTSINKLFSKSISSEDSIKNRLKDLNIKTNKIDVDCKDNYLISKLLYNSLK